MVVMMMIMNATVTASMATVVMKMYLIVLLQTELLNQPNGQYEKGKL